MFYMKGGENMANGRNRFSEKRLRQNISELTKRKEFWIGLLTLLVIVGITGGLVVKNVRDVREQASRHAAPVSPVPQQADQQAAVASPTVAAAPQGQVQGPISQIKKLANTSSAVTVAVRANESFWHIAKRVCGTDRYYLSVAAQNGNMPLHPGDIVTVSCVE